MIVSLFRNVQARIPREKNFLWDEFVEQLTNHKPTDQKKIDLPLFSLAKFDGQGRYKQNVVSVQGAVLDLDDITKDQWDEVHNKLIEQNIASCWYTSYSHSPPTYKLRVVLQLSRSLTVAEWDRLTPHLRKEFNTDPKTLDAGHIFFGPFIPTNSSGHFTGRNDGNPFDVDTILNTTQTDEIIDVDLPPLPTEEITKKQLSTLIRNLKQKEDSKAQISAALLQAIRDGKPFTEEGYRDSAIFQYVAAALVKKWPGIDTEKFAELATPSIAETGGVTVEQFIYKLEREKENRRQWLEKLQRDKEQKQRDKLTRDEFRTELFGVAKYDEDDLKPIIGQTVITAKDIEINPKNLKVIQHGRDIYFWAMGKYEGPFDKTAFRTYAAQYLAPFPDAKKDLFGADGKLLKEFSLDDFILDHGHAVKEVIKRLGNAQPSVSTGQLILPYYPPLKYEPKYSWKVDLWLTHLFGGSDDPDEEGKIRVELGKMWLYHYSDASRLLPALLLVGATGAGKGLFCQWLSYQYGKNGKYGDLNRLYSQSNENEVHPIMVADEQFPDCTSAELRDSITRYQHIHKQKYKNAVTVEGYIRHIIILNDADRIKTFDVGVEAQRATAERFLFVPVTAKCREYLQMLIRSHEPLYPGELQEHIEWMHQDQTFREKYEVEPSAAQRFTLPMETLNQSFAESFYRQEGRFEVLNVICDFICRDRLAAGILEQYKEFPIEVKENGEVWLRPALFFDFAQEHLSKRSKSYVSRILKSIAEPIRYGGSRYWSVDVSHLYKWADVAMEYSDEDIKEALSMPTKEKIDRLDALN